MQLLELPKTRNQPVGHEGWRRSDAQPVGCAAGLGAPACQFDAVERGREFAQQIGAHLGELQPATRAVKETLPEPGFQLQHLLADCAGSHAELFGGCRDAAFASDNFEDAHCRKWWKTTHDVFLYGKGWRKIFAFPLD